MPSKQNLEAFWKQGDGKLIKSYGDWLIAYGIMLGLVSAFFLLTSLSIISELAGYGIMLVGFYVFAMATSIYYINRGYAIRKTSLTPAQMSFTTTIILILMLSVLFWSSMSSDHKGAVAFGLLDLITFMETIKYKRKWHKSYVAAYSGKVKVDIKDDNRHNHKKEIKEAHALKNKKDEYEDDLL